MRTPSAHVGCNCAGLALPGPYLLKCSTVEADSAGRPCCDLQQRCEWSLLCQKSCLSTPWQDVTRIVGHHRQSLRIGASPTCSQYAGCSVPHQRSQWVKYREKWRVGNLWCRSWCCTVLSAPESCFAPGCIHRSRATMTASQEGMNGAIS